MIKANYLIINTLCIFCVIVLCSTEAAAHDASGIFAEIFTPSLYEDQSAFTLIPATVGEITLGIPAFLIGGTIYLAGYTLGLPFDKEDEFSALGIYTGIGVLKLGGYTAGAPFYAIEKTFYDIPVSFFFRNEEGPFKDKPIGITKEHHPAIKTKPLGKIALIQSQNGKIIQVEEVDFNDCRTTPSMGLGKAGFQAGHSLQLSSGYCNEKTERIINRTTLRSR